MGWNSWYIHKRNVTDTIMRQAADAMIATGMADYGYEYVNVDDCWMVLADSTDPVLGGPMRDATGRLRGNGHFPDMKALADYIHAKGLKAGLYSSPGRATCGGFAGSHAHEAIDAATFADWGFDFLKYDWCTYEKIAPNHSLPELQAPFARMREQLLKQPRDIQFNICQYGMGEVWTWAGQLGESWRTTDDLGWKGRQAMPGFFYVGRSNAEHWAHARPGNWNDPDYLLLGFVRDPFRQNQIFPADLSPSENYFYMSMWAMMTAPLFFSGDMTRLDDFLLNVLCNHEVIEVNLDPLGRQGRILRDQHNQMIMLKELEGGAKAIGLFHLSGPVADPSGFAVSKEKQLAGIKPIVITQDMGDPVAYVDWGEPVKISVSADELGLTGRFKVRDLWRQRDLGEFTHHFTASVPFHGVALLRVTPAP
jgi:alpha-galactosidase